MELSTPHMDRRRFPGQLEQAARRRSYTERAVHAATKRAFDFLLAMIGVVVFAPVGLLIALAILIDDGLPIFYCQERVGRSGRLYKVRKFRSMVVDAESETGPVAASPDDHRVTRVGWWLRRTAMDELPQVLSILVGDMSFVGPRSYREVFVAQFREMIPDHDLVLRVRPGLTGLAQIYGPKRPSAYQKWRLDVLYIESQSLWLDFRLIAASVWITLQAKWETHTKRR